MKNEKRRLVLGGMLLGAFVVWTVLVLTIDVQPWGQNGTNIGFATLNTWFHGLTGVHMGIYVVLSSQGNFGIKIGIFLTQTFHFQKCIQEKKIL